MLQDEKTVRLVKRKIIGLPHGLLRIFWRYWETVGGKYIRAVYKTELYIRTNRLEAYF